MNPSNELESVYFLAEAAKILFSSTDYAETLNRMAWLLVPSRADWCVVELLQKTNGRRRVVCAHKDGELAKKVIEFENRFPIEGRKYARSRLAIEERRSELIPDFNLVPKSKYAEDNERIEIFNQFGMKSYVGVPIVVRGMLFGVISLFTAESNRIFDEEDLATVEDLSVYVAIAIDNARLLKINEFYLGQKRADADELAKFAEMDGLSLYWPIDTPRDTNQTPSSSSSNLSTVQFPFRLDTKSFEVVHNHRHSEPLTASEFKIMSIIAKSPDFKLTRAILVKELWDVQKVGTNSLDMHLYRLRKKLAPIDLRLAFQSPNFYALEF
jgi:hypothetical protein